MSRYVEITKDGNNYNVNPNATPSGGSTTIYNWATDGGGGWEENLYMDFSEPLQNPDDLFTKHIFSPNNLTVSTFQEVYDQVGSNPGPLVSYTINSDTSFTIRYFYHGTSSYDTYLTFTREPEHDLTFWN